MVESSGYHANVNDIHVEEASESPFCHIPRYGAGEFKQEGNYLQYAGYHRECGRKHCGNQDFSKKEIEIRIVYLSDLEGKVYDEKPEADQRCEVVEGIV